MSSPPPQPRCLLPIDKHSLHSGSTSSTPSAPFANLDQGALPPHGLDVHGNQLGRICPRDAFELEPISELVKHKVTHWKLNTDSAQELTDFSWVHCLAFFSSELLSPFRYYLSNTTAGVQHGAQTHNPHGLGAGSWPDGQRLSHH